MPRGALLPGIRALARALTQGKSPVMVELLRTGPSSSPRLLLAHGAGAPMDSPFMDAIAERVADAYSLSPSIELVWIEDGDHSLKPRKASGRTLDQNLAAAAHAVVGLIERLA